MIVYKYTNKINDKVYIGITTRSLEERHKDHVQSEINTNNAFHKALKKYGVKNFDLQVIDTAETLEELKEKEKRWIQKCNSWVHAKNSNGYNVTLGGDGVFGLSGEKAYWYGKSRSDETRKKISVGRIGKYTGENSYWYGKGYLVSGANNHNYGKPLSQEVKDEHSKVMKGRYAGAKNPRAKSIICITTGETFEYVKQASEKYGINKADISRCCKGILKSAGKHPTTKGKMLWKYNK